MEPRTATRAPRLAFRTAQPQYAPSPLGQAVKFDGNLVFDAGNVASFDYRDRLHDFKDRFVDLGLVLSRVRK